MYIFVQSGFKFAKWLYSGKSDCIQEKVDVFGQSGFNLSKWLYSGGSECIREKVVVFARNLLHPGKSGYIRAKWL